VIIAVVVACLLPVCFGALGVDISQLTSVTAFKCLKEKGYSFAIPRVWQSTGHPDPNGPKSMANAHEAGFTRVDGYIFPCPHCGDGAKQIRESLAFLKSAGAHFDTIWLDIEGKQYWKDAAYNKAFFEDMVKQLKSAGQKFGIYTSASQWDPIFGSAYHGGSAYELWYAHYDGHESFSDFQAFAGWSKPTIKQFRGDVSLCGAGIDQNWHP